MRLVAAFTGLRKGEISALMWEQYREGLLYVEKSKWRTHLSGPKTRKSKSPVPVIAPLAKILERWRGTMGNPDSGWMFGSGPLDVENFDDRQIMLAAARNGPFWRDHFDVTARESTRAQTD